MGETVNGLPVAVLVVLVGGALVVAAWLALRFGRIIGVGVLILGILVVAVLGAGALAGQSAANYQTARAATEAAEAAKAASVGQSLTGLILVAALGGMGTLTLAAVGTAGYFAVRYKLSERGAPRLEGASNGLLNPGRERARVSQRQSQQRPPEIVYIESGGYVDDGLDLWGWGNE